MILYRLLLSLFAAGVLMRHPMPAHWKARLGHGLTSKGPTIWLHGASNGELASVRPLLESLIEARPDLHWRITANSETGVALAQGWSLPRTSVHLAPLDLASVTRRAMRGVIAHVSLEAELWPNRFRLCPGPVLLLGARMSDGTAKGWAKVPALARATLNVVTLAIPQDARSLENLGTLGLPESAKGPVVDLKALYQPPAAMVPDEALQAAFPKAQTWLAASTHEGEEEIVLKTHKSLLEEEPEAKLILAPRHPRRGDDIAALIRSFGLTLARRSLGEAPDAQVYLADTMGEMPLWYALAGRVFIAGSLESYGGHTPYEPARFGCALLYGNDTSNFRAAYTRLKDAQAALRVHDVETLLIALRSLQTPEEQADFAARAAAALHQDIDLAALTDRILAALPPARQA